MGGKKRKIEIEKIEEKTSKSVAFTKRRLGLFRKASMLCELSPLTQIAILVTPISINSHTFFYSFGHPSAYEVINSFLHNQSPPNKQFVNTNSGLGFWWEDRSFDVYEDVEELEEAVGAVSTMLNTVKLRLDEAMKSDEILGFHQEEKQLVTTNQNPKFEGETSASATYLLPKEEDILQIDGLLTDFDIESFQF